MHKTLRTVLLVLLIGATGLALSCSGDPSGPTDGGGEPISDGARGEVVGEGPADSSPVDGRSPDRSEAVGDGAGVRDSGGGADPGAPDTATGDAGPGDLPPPDGPGDRCAGCHGTVASPAPPPSTEGKTATHERGVGAHQQHLGKSNWRAPVKCESCHKVPATLSAKGHTDTPRPAEVTFSGLALAKGMRPTWDGTVCNNTYCHGGTLSGGTFTSPRWTQVDGSQAQCDSCHGLPPNQNHTANQNCHFCHAAVVNKARKIIAPQLHIDGKLSVKPVHPTGWKQRTAHGPAFRKAPDSCGKCHGADLKGGLAQVGCDPCHQGSGSSCTLCHGGKDSRNGAPPRSLDGKTDPSAPGVGRHTVHLADTPLHKALACATCHKVPTALNTPGHIDPRPAELTFSGLAKGAVYDRKTRTCSRVYCHGPGKKGSTGKAVWTGTLKAGCGSCHDDEKAGKGMTLGGAHKKHVVDRNHRCSQCHGCVVDRAKQITDPKRHVDGKIDVCYRYWDAKEKKCRGCHLLRPRKWY